MSGHSKWATTKRRKSVVDAKRGSQFTKLAKLIAVAAKDGADPESNFKLRMAIDKAKSYSLPKDNIERAIARGSGQGGGQTLETIIYEAYGPEGAALLIETVTDNKNRTVSDIKNILAKHGGHLGSAGSVKWQFELKGVIHLKTNQLNEEQQLQLIDLGAEDIVVDEESALVICPPEILQNLKQKIQSANWPEILEASTDYQAKDNLQLKQPQKMIGLLEALEESDDVNNVYTNAAI